MSKRIALLALLSPLLLAAATAARPVGEPVVVTLTDGDEVRGVVAESGPNHVTLDRGGPKGPFHDPIVRISRDDIARIGEPLVDPVRSRRWVHLGFGASGLGGRAFAVTFEGDRGGRRSWKVAAMLVSNGEPYAEPVPAALLREDPVARESAFSIGPALGWRTGGRHASAGWSLGGAALAGRSDRNGSFLSAGLLAGVDLFLAPTDRLGIGISQMTNLNPELPFTAAFLTLRLGNGS